MLPLGASRWSLNESAGLAGMALFFTLSGFLIVTTLYRTPSVPSFLIRRLSRIVPLALLATVVYLAIQGKSWDYYPSHLLFYINYDHTHITSFTSHFWSLCVEVHFYAVAATLAAILGLRGMLLLPVMGFAITMLRVQQGDKVNIMTHLRSDEILAGALLALIWLRKIGRYGRPFEWALRTVPSLIWAFLFLASCHKISGPMQFFRHYFAAALVGSTLICPDLKNTILSSKTMRYIAEISFALYVIHPLTMYGWLGSGNTTVKYLKRPICFAMAFGLAHLSTFGYERRWMAFGKRLARRWEHRILDVIPEPFGGKVSRENSPILSMSDNLLQGGAKTRPM
jgi:peptidoglycan/LPS O-acetylase OafA/YrhL